MLANAGADVRRPLCFWLLKRKRPAEASLSAERSASWRCDSFQSGGQEPVLQQTSPVGQSWSIEHAGSRARMIRQRGNRGRDDQAPADLVPIPADPLRAGSSKSSSRASAARKWFCFSSPAREAALRKSAFSYWIPSHPPMPTRCTDRERAVATSSGRFSRWCS